MSNSLNLIVDIVALSCCFWAIFGLYSAFCVGRFIVKRYEQETDLTKTSFFVNHFPFARYLPNFFSSEIYSGHLMISLLGWRYFKGKKVFKDIKSSDEITKYFSKKEIRKVKQYAFAILIFSIHIMVYFVFSLLGPDLFSYQCP